MFGIGFALILNGLSDRIAELEKNQVAHASASTEAEARIAILEAEAKSNAERLDLAETNIDSLRKWNEQLTQHYAALYKIALYVAEESDRQDLVEELKTAFRVSGSKEEPSDVEHASANSTAADGANGSPDQGVGESGDTAQPSGDGHHSEQAPGQS